MRGGLAGPDSRQPGGRAQSALVREMTVQAATTNSQQQEQAIRMDRLAGSQERAGSGSSGSLARRQNQVAPFKRASTLGSAPQQPATGSLQDLKSAQQQHQHQQLTAAQRLQQAAGGAWRPLSGRLGGGGQARPTIQSQSSFSSTQSIQQQILNNSTTLQQQHQQLAGANFRQTSNWPSMISGGQHSAQAHTSQQSHSLAGQVTTASKAIALDGSSCSAAPSKHSPAIVFAFLCVCVALGPLPLTTLPPLAGRANLVFLGASSSPECRLSRRRAPRETFSLGGGFRRKPARLMSALRPEPEPE